MKFLPMFLLIAVGVCQAAPPDRKSPDRLASLRTAATDCYAAIRLDYPGGLPSKENLQRLKPLLTPGLNQVLGLALERQQQHVKQHPDEKPDWADGDLFSSLAEGVKQWETGEAIHYSGPEAMVKMNLTYAEPGQPDVKWTDTLIFQLQQGGWKLDDIRMGGKGTFNSGHTLRARLPGGSWENSDHRSPDDRWQVVFDKEGDAVNGITIQPVDSASGRQTLFGAREGEGCPYPTWLVWSPLGDKLAVRLGDGPRFTRTLVWRLVDRTWQSVDLPDFYAREKRTLEENGFRERNRLVDAQHWQDADTLVVEYFGNWTKEDEGDGFFKTIRVRIGARGKAALAGATDRMPED